MEEQPRAAAEPGAARSAGGAGVLFITTGPFYTERAVEAARSVRETNPELPIAIFTDQPLDDPLFDHVLPIENAHRRSKVDCLPMTPFERTLYLDSDTRVRGDIGPLFELLDRFDIAVAHVRYRAKAKRLASVRRPVPRSFPQMNCGVMLYARNERALSVLEAWRDAFHASGLPTDQGTFRECVWYSDARLYILPPEYNTRTRFFGWKTWKLPKPVILHYRRYHSRFWTRPWPARIGRALGLL